MADVPPSEVADDEAGAAENAATEEDGGNGDPDGGAEVEARPAEPGPGPVAEPGPGPVAAPPRAVPRVRVDARLLEATLLNLRKRIAAIPLVFELPGADEVTAERAKLLSQIDDYLLPRVRQSAAPVLVALVGSTGAGKSTLVNSIVGSQVSVTGVRRPTTNSPVLACHPEDIEWFAENMFLPTLPRVRQEGLARPGRDGLLVLAASEGMPKGIALLDTPDIDSVVRAHHEFAYQFLDASDLWLFMTSAGRYADAPVWEILQHARERGAALGVVLSRVPPSHRTELVDHFTAMLDANGISATDRFVIQETGIVDGMLPTEVFEPIRDWLADTAQRTDRRVAVLTQTMSGVLDTFKIRVPKLAAHVDAQVALRAKLRRDAEDAYRRALADFDGGTRKGSLLSGEITARWQDYAVSGELGAALRSRRVPRKGRRARRGQVMRGQGVTRTAALDSSVRSALESLVVSVADRAAEQVAARWRADPAGAALLIHAAAVRAEGERAEQVFESAFGPDSHAAQARAAEQHGANIDRSSPDLPPRVARAVSAWQDHLMRLVQAENTAKRGGGRPDYESEPLSLVTLIAMLGEGTERTERTEGTGGTERSQPAAETGGAPDSDIITVPHDLLTSVFGTVELAEITARARADLLERVRLLLDEELLRFVEVIDSAGPVDEVAAVRLYQAEYSLEAAR
ncbi:MAG: 50S ribosome-binding GTPase [Streptosporangiaceae bacterium]|nr:50S ribosome-binding GTPase [Streptosporangiaceae bacterium]MBV9854642.1 50S ribosome-binding GTPase [Streptosporangiaceae bacterium]